MVQLICSTVIILILSIGNVKGACSSGCTSCSNSTCSNCGPSYFLSSGNCHKCPDNCKTCDTYDKCTSCQSDKYGLADKCILTCATSCLNGECRDDTGYCYSCKAGTYGPKCQQNCTLCKDGLCDLTKCTNGCALGYYEYKTDTETFCQACPSDCKSCNNSTVCNMCNDGFYIYSVLLNDGTTVNYCYECPSDLNCKSCEVVQNTPIACTGCSEGYILDSGKCIVNDNMCNSGCSSECNEYGICLGSCKSGKTGEQCSESCASRCLNCYKYDANICLECNGDFYTNSCNTACSSLCRRITGTQTCRINDGYCLNGCDDEFGGSRCNQPCSNGCVNDGVSEICDRGNGTCMKGCKPGYNGETCLAVTVTTESDVQSESTGTSTETTSFQTNVHSIGTTSAAIVEKSVHCQDEINGGKIFAIAYLSGFGTAVFIVAVTTTLYYVRRRYLTKQSKQPKQNHGTTDISKYSNETFKQTQESERLENDKTNYERLKNNRNVEKVYSELE